MQISLKYDRIIKFLSLWIYFLNPWHWGFPFIVTQQSIDGNGDGEEIFWQILIGDSTIVSYYGREDCYDPTAKAQPWSA